MKKVKSTKTSGVSDGVDHTLGIMQDQGSASRNMESSGNPFDNTTRWSSSSSSSSFDKDDPEMITRTGPGANFTGCGIAAGAMQGEDVVMQNLWLRCKQNIPLDDWKRAYTPDLSSADMSCYEQYYKTKSNRPNMGCTPEHFGAQVTKFFKPFLDKKTTESGYKIIFADTSNNAPWGHETKFGVIGMRLTGAHEDRLVEVAQKREKLDTRAKVLGRAISKVKKDIMKQYGSQVPYKDLKRWGKILYNLERKKFRIENASIHLRQTGLQHVFLAMEHTWQGKKSPQLCMEPSIWVMTKKPPTDAQMREKLIEQSRLLDTVFRYQFFRKCIYHILVINGWWLLCYQDRSFLALSEPLNINDAAHRDFIFRFSHTLVVDECPKLLGYPPCAEKIGKELHTWQFYPGHKSQWIIQLTIKKQDSLVSETKWSTVEACNYLPYIRRASLTGRNLFGWEVKQIEPATTDETRLYLKFEWTPMHIKATHPKLDNLVLTCELDFLRLHEEMNLWNHLKIIASGKLYHTEPEIQSGRRVTFVDAERVQQDKIKKQIHLCQGRVPRYSKPYVQYRACVLITRYTRTFEEKIRPSPRSAHITCPYFMFGGLAYELTAYKSTGFIQGDISFSNMRLNGDDSDDTDYSAQTECHANVGDFDMAESSDPNGRKDNAHMGTRVFMAYDCLLDTWEKGFQKLLYHDVESWWWAGNIAIFRTLEAYAAEKSCVNRVRFNILTESDKEALLVDEGANEEANTTAQTEIKKAEEVLPGRTDDDEVLHFTDSRNPECTNEYLKQVFDDYQRKCYITYETLSQSFPLWKNMYTCQEKLSDWKLQILRLDREGFRGSWPDVEELKEWGMPDVDRAIELMTDIHELLNCKLREKATSKDLKQLYKLKGGLAPGSDVELGVDVAEQILKLLEKFFNPQAAVDPGEDMTRSQSGETLFKQMLDRQALVDRNKSKALQDFAQKYPDLVKNSGA